MKLSSSERALIRQRIHSTAAKGKHRDLLLWKYLYGREVMPSRRDWIEACIHMKHKRTGRVGPILLNGPQRHVEAVRLRHQRANKRERYATLKARQYGMTRYWLATGLEYVTRDEYMPACIIADEEANARAVLEDGKIMCDRLPVALPRKYSNRSQLYFDKPIMGYIDVETAKADNPCRSRTYRLVHATEPGIWKDPEKKVASVNQAVPDEPGTVISYEGTAAGQGNWWYDFWWAAYEGKNDYHAFFFPWFADADFDYRMELEEGESAQIWDTLDEEESSLLALGCAPEQLKWRRYAIRNRFFGDLDLFHQEFPATPEEAFLTSGRPCFVPQHVLGARRRCKEPAFRGNILVGRRNPKTEQRDYTLAPANRGTLLIWADPVPGRMYCMGADSGAGAEVGDFSTAEVLDMETGHQVAELRTSTNLTEFARQLCCLGWHYNTAYAMPEIERSGIAVLDTMKDEGYYMIGRRPVYDTAGRMIGRKLAWSTNVQTRPLLFNEIRKNLAMGAEGCEINSEYLCREMIAMYINAAGKEDHPSGKHDDLVLAYGIALMARKDAVEAGALQEMEEKMPRDESARHWYEFRKSLEHSEEEEYAEWTE